jgi:uncharacterized membrane protein YhaH (DUF805 family)
MNGESVQKRALNAVQHLFYGRINRLQFFLAGLLVFVLPIFFILFFLVATARLLMPLTAALIVYDLEIAILCAALFMASGLYVRRLHDMGWPGWMVSFQILNATVVVSYLIGWPIWVFALLLFLPLLNGITFLIVLFWPGKRDASKYGPSPQANRSIQSVIFNKNGNPDDRGETWLARIFFGISVLAVLLYVLAQTNVPVYFGITPLHPDVVYTVNGQQVRVPFGNLKILCGSEELDITKAAPFPEPGSALSNLVPTCGGNSDVKFLYGTNDVYDVFLRNSGWFSLSQRYLVMLSRKTAGQENLNDYALAIYKTTPTLEKVYDDDFGVIPQFAGSPGDGISFEDVNKDGKTDLRICLPTAGSSNCRVYFAQPETDTFVRWITAERDVNSSYAVEAQVIYYDGVAMPDVDLSSFSIINDQYAKDNGHVYSFGKILLGVDPASFEIVDVTGLGRYTKDKDHVYFSGDVIMGADPATFAYIDGDYSKDRINVYMATQQIAGADPNTFQIVQDTSDSFNWSKDKNHVYYNGAVLENALPQYFKAVTSDFGTDGLNVFYGIRAVDGSDPKTFTLIKAGYPSYAIDASQVYFEGAIDASPVIIGADPTTFAVVGDNYSKDKQHVFYKITAILGADSATIVYLGDVDGSQYAKDKNFVYRDGEILPGANPATYAIY